MAENSKVLFMVLKDGITVLLGAVIYLDKNTRHACAELFRSSNVPKRTEDVDLQKRTEEVEYLIRKILRA